MKSLCLFIIQHDYSVWDKSVDSEGNPVYSKPTELVAKLCLNNCSMNGDCNKGNKTNIMNIS